MYSFDSHGNVLIDSAQAALISDATRRRTLSPRAATLSQGISPQFNPVTPHTLGEYSSRISNIVKELWAGMREPVRNNQARSGSDFKALYSKVITDMITVDMQGFVGPVPIVSVESGLASVVFFMPADGAVIRYLARLLRNAPDELLVVSIGSGTMGLQGTLSTISGDNAVLGPNLHCMSIRVSERFGTGINRIEGVQSVLTGAIRALELSDYVPVLRQVLTTLSRRIQSQDGSWGEEPKFPIVNFKSKMIEGARLERPSTLTPLLHGNNRHIFGDRQVYSVIALGDKLPFTATSGSTGEYKWTQPRA